MEFFKSEYKKEWQFFKKEMKTIFFIMLIGVILLAIGTHYLFVTAYKMDNGLLQQVVTTINQVFAGIDIGDSSATSSILKLFFNNARACLIAVSVGVIPFLFLSVFNLGVNGMVVGMVTSMSKALGGFGLSFFLAGPLSHGIFEIPAIVYSCALGFYMCKESSKVLLNKSDKRFGAATMETIRSYVLVVLPLLIIAAILESTLTVFILSKFV